MHGKTISSLAALTVLGSLGATALAQDTRHDSHIAIDNPDLMTYCHECHQSVADRDYTFFIPEENRIGD